MQRQDILDRLSRKFRHFNADRQWRDYRVTRDSTLLRNINRDRKKLGQTVAVILKKYKGDDMRILAEMNQASRDSNVSTQMLRTVATKRWGEELFSNFGWKDGWQQPVWEGQAWFRDSVWYRVHQVHQSEDNPAMIAYNRSIDNIKRNIQTRTKPGKYLTQFFGDVLSQDQIREWAEKQIAFASCEAELKFVENDAPDMWIQVYENGPHSCMQGKDAVQVYCYPDNGLRLAYLEQGDDIVARAIVRNKSDGTPAGYIRIYSTEQRWTTKLREDLDAAGYGEQVNLNNVKLRRIDEEHECGQDGVVCPYIDTGNYGTQKVSIRENYLLITEDGDVSATNTCGTIPLYDGRECDECGDTCDEDDMTYVESTEQTVCQHCLDNNFTYAHGRRHQDYFSNDDVIYCESNGEWYHEEYANYNDVYQCRVSDDWYHLDDLVCCDVGEYEGDFIHVDEAVRVDDEQWAYQGDCTKLDDGEWVLDEYAAPCHITGGTFDIRKGVKIDLHSYRNVRGFQLTKSIYVSPDAWTIDNIREHFVRCGDLLLTNIYFGNVITDSFEPDNVEYGDDFDGDKIEDMEFIEYAEAA